jgi:NTP pyrophosphatase (non-canonical NTP hydrolase)
MLVTARELMEMYPLGSSNFNPEDFGEISALIESGNGFDSTDNKTLPAKLMLVVTEVAEAIQWCESGEGDPLYEEIADIMIRLFAMVHTYAAYLRAQNHCQRPWRWRYTNLTQVMVPGTGQSYIRDVRNKFPIERIMWDVVRQLCNAMERYRHSSYEKALESMETALSVTAEIADVMDIDWRSSVKSKTLKNLGRPYLHGKSSTA